MKLRGALLGILCEIVSKVCKEYASFKNRKKISCAKMLKALGSMLKKLLLYCEKFMADIRKLGHKVNPCDPCAANKHVGNNQHALIA